MTAGMDADITYDDTGRRPRLAWEVPEVAAMAVLVAFTVLAVGGLVAGIVFSTQVGGYATSREFAGEAIEFGASWAEPLLAIALLGVVGLSWWQIEAWAETGGEEPQLSRQREVRGHTARACRLGVAAQISLLLTLAGSVAALVGTVMAGPGTGVQVWWRYVVGAASLIGVLSITAGGWKIGQTARSGLASASADG